MSNQMTGLYQRAPPAARGSPQQTPSTSTASILQQESVPGRPFMSLSAVRKNQAGTGAEGSGASRNPGSNSHLNPKYRGLEKVDSSSSSSLASDSMLLLDDEKDDDDLEILEVFGSDNSARPTPPNSSSALSRRNLMQKDLTTSEQLEDATRRGSKLLPSSVVGVPVSVNVQLTSSDKGTQALIPDKIELETEKINVKIPNANPLAAERKGIKRSRAVVRAEAEYSTPGPSATARVSSTPKPKEAGIGNLTRKLRKEIAVVQESNYTFADFGGSEKVLEVSIRSLAQIPDTRCLFIIHYTFLALNFQLHVTLCFLSGNMQVADALETS